MARRKLKAAPKRKKSVERQRPISKTIRARQTNYDKTDLTPEAQQTEFLKITNIPQLVHELEKNTDGTLDVEARVMCVNSKEQKVKNARLGKKEFIEAFKSNRKRTFREALDSFSFDSGSSSGIGKDFVPLLGGPFNKQLYIYDYLKMHATAFQAYNHDPVAGAAVEIIRDFVIGRGWRVDCDDPKALAIWRAFEEVNNLDELMDNFCKELSIYGEQMVWWLPNNATKISYKVMDGQKPPTGILPRVRLIDPSVIWEIVTYPEDITRVLYYQWVAPTQYQMYTGSDGGKPVPGTKFIYQQIPANQVDHYKINCSSNEKRGRSDLFRVLDYCKRLRDSVSYSIIALQKATAWSIDTVVDGNDADINTYIQSQQEIGTIPPPGSEFVHSKKIERKYMSNEGAGRGQNSNAFDWALSMICAGLGIPVNYFGTHLSNTSTRASAITAVEPVTKKFENRRKVIEKCLKNMAKRLFADFGIDAEVEISFPELITQDRSAKLKDLIASVAQEWISNERAAQIAAKELDISDFDYNEEMKKIKVERESNMSLFNNPLTDAPLPGQKPGEQKPPGQSAPDDGAGKDNNMTGEDKRKVRMNNGY